MQHSIYENPCREAGIFCVCKQRYDKTGKRPIVRSRNGSGFVTTIYLKRAFIQGFFQCGGY